LRKAAKADDDGVIAVERAVDEKDADAGNLKMFSMTKEPVSRSASIGPE